MYISMYLVSVFNFNYNVEEGEQTAISKSVTLRTLVVLLEIFIPDPWSYFLVALYNELTSF